MKLTRDEVHRIVAAEGEYEDMSLETWILWMEEYLAEARKCIVSGYNRGRALECLRCVLSFGINAAMYHGIPDKFPELMNKEEILEMFKDTGESS